MFRRIRAFVGYGWIVLGLGELLLSAVKGWAVSNLVLGIIWLVLGLLWLLVVDRQARRREHVARR